MSYTQNAGEVTARFHPGGEQGSVTFGKSATVARFVAPGSATEGRFGMFEWNMQPHSGGPDAHFHKTFSESFYVMSGTVRLFNGEEWVNATMGDFLYVP